MTGRQIYILLGIVMVFMAACTENKKKPVNSEFLERITARAKNPENRLLEDSCIAMLHQGDIVVRRGNDVTSDMLSLLNFTDKKYSHCGIVLVEHGYPFVYHCMGGEDNPDARMRRDSAQYWLTPANNVAIGVVRTDMPAVNKDSLVHVVHGYYKQRKKFDIKFDLRTDDRFYCAELVYKAMNRAMKNDNYLQPITIFGFTYIGIDNLYLNPHASLICQIRYK